MPRNLSAEGVAYISYNTYPGWKTSDVVRDAMQLNSFAATTQIESCNAPRKCWGCSSKASGMAIP